MMAGKFLRSLLAGGVCALALAGGAVAQTRNFAVPAGDLKAALDAYMRQSGVELIYRSDEVRGKRTAGVAGAMAADQALERILAGSNLAATRDTSGAVVVASRPQSGAGASPAVEAAQVSELVVTGSNIRGAPPVGARPTVIGRDDIAKGGFATAQAIVQSIPQNFGGGPSESTQGYSSRNNAAFNTSLGAGVNLRGLGSNSTLVLINGVRPALGGIAGAFADVSLIPTSALQRVEVLTDGASAVYGSDAVAGVVNFILRDDFEGIETRARYATADGDADEVQASVIGGWRWRGGRLVAAYEFYDHNALGGEGHDYFTEDLRPFGGADYRDNSGAPGNIVAGGVTYGIPAGQNGVGLTAAQLRPGVPNKADGQSRVDILPAQRRHTLYVSAEQEVAGFTAFAEVLGAQREFSRRGMGALTMTTVSVPRTNPFYLNPTGGTGPVSVQYDFRGDLGASRYEGGVHALNVTGGLTRRFGDWSATAQGGFGEQYESYAYLNEPNLTRLAMALADPNPATAYNVFGDAGSTPAATRDAIRGFFGATNHYRIWSASLRADGPLFDAPAGAVRVALGGEWRSERFRQESISYLTGLAPSRYDPLYPGAREISAAYVEVRAPLIDEAMAVPGVRRLSLAAAGRIERYSDVGSTANPKFGVDWQPVEALTVRGSFGRSFRAPSFKDLQTGPDVEGYQPTVLVDPSSPTGKRTVLALLGNAPDIGPEKATTWSLGADFRPASLPGLTASLSYFDIRYRDRIANVNGNFANLLIERATYADVITDNPSAAVVAAYYANPYFFNSANIPASAIEAIIDLRNRNLSTVRENGLDLDVGYATDTRIGRVGAGVSGSYIFHVRQKVTAGAPSADIVGTVGAPVHLRLRARADWTSGPWTAAVFVNYIGGYPNQLVVPRRHVDAWTTVDTHLSYALPAAWPGASGAKVSLSVSNLFDRDPPFAELRTVTSAVGYDAEKASAVGRLVAVELVKSW